MLAGEAMTERDLQHAIVRALRQAGCTVFVTSGAQGHACHSDDGRPDLFVLGRNPIHGSRQWYGVEVKTPKGKLHGKQIELEQQRAIVVVRSVDDALRAAGIGGK